MPGEFGKYFTRHSSGPGKKIPEKKVGSWFGNRPGVFSGSRIVPGSRYMHGKRLRGSVRSPWWKKNSGCRFMDWCGIISEEIVRFSYGK